MWVGTYLSQMIRPDGFSTSVFDLSTIIPEPAEHRSSAQSKGKHLPPIWERKRVFHRERESFFLAMRLSSHGARRGMEGGDTINQSHVLETISRSMPGPPPKSGSLSRSVAFLDSDVAASTSVDAYLSTYLPTYLGRCTVSTYSPPFYRVTQNRRRRLTMYTHRFGATRPRTFVRIFADPLISSRDSSDCKSGRMKEESELRAPLAPVVDKTSFFSFFYLK